MATTKEKFRNICKSKGIHDYNKLSEITGWSLGHCRNVWYIEGKGDPVVKMVLHLFQKSVD